MAADTPRRPPAGPVVGVAVLRRYRPAWLRGDLAAGVTVGALLITQCMAYAPLAGLPPAPAVSAVLVALPVYALAGTSRHLVVGPDPGTAAVAGAGLASVAAVGSTAHLEAAAALAVMVGVVLVVAGLLRLGFVSSLLSRPALVGYLSGLGATLLVGQVPKLTGITFSSDRFFARLADLVTGLDTVNGATAAMGLGTLAVILVTRRVAPRLPAAVLGVIAATVVAAAGSLDRHGVALVGPLDAAVPTPGLPDVPAATWGALVPTAIAVAVLGYADSFLTAKGVAGRQGYALDATREFGGLGAANLAAGAFGGMPVSSTGSGTAAAAAAGGTTQLTLVVAAVVVLVGAVVVPGAIEAVPVAALAAVVVNAAISLLDPAGFRRLWQESRLEFLLAVATFVAVCAFDVLAGIIISIALGLLVALARMARPHDAVLGDAHLDGWVDTDQYAGATTEPGLLVYRFDAPLFFVNVARFTQRVQEVLEENPGRERWVVLDFEGVGSVDTSATEALADLAGRLVAAGVEHVGVARANAAAIDRLRRAGLLAPDGPVHVHPTINGAVAAYRAAAGGR